MRILKNLSRYLASMKITVKIGLAFSLMLMILLVEMIIGYSALSAILQSNNAILANAEIQRLAMGMSRNWESVQRLQYSFFFQSPILGVDQAYETYALPAGGKITEVIRDGATLKRLVSSPDASDILHQRETDLKLYLSTVSQYASRFEETTELEFLLRSEETGLQPQLEQKSAALSAILLAADQSTDVSAAYFEMRFLEKDYLTSSARYSIEEVLDAASRLRHLIAYNSMQVGAKESALSALDEYESVANEIFITNSQIQEKLNQLDTLNQSVEPVLIELRIAVDTEVGNARLKIEETRQTAINMLVAAVLFGLLSAITIAVLLNYIVTRNIINLTRVASQFNNGNLDARARVESSDELGKLATTFNEMAETVDSLHAELREQAIRDSLTNLFNRRYHDEMLPRELEGAARAGYPVTLVMIDLDNFKEINDEHGHAVGDQILMEFGRILRLNTRRGDMPCRFGGDEFIVLLPGARLKDGVKCANGWKQKLIEVAVPSNGGSVQVTFSAGVVEWIPGETPKELFARVDAALYAAKNIGRDRVYALSALDGSPADD